jgi:hypothetical protein
VSSAYLCPINSEPLDFGAKNHYLKKNSIDEFAVKAKNHWYRMRRVYAGEPSRFGDTTRRYADHVLTVKTPRRLALS